MGENEWNKGTFVFKGQQYSAENLKYDVDTDKLIYLSYSSDFQMNCIALDQNFVSEFSIQNATFRYFDNLVTQRGVNLRKGYYEVVYDGKLKFLSRKIKVKILWWQLIVPELQTVDRPVFDQRWQTDQGKKYGKTDSPV